MADLSNLIRKATTAKTQPNKFEGLEIGGVDLDGPIKPRQEPAQARERVPATPQPKPAEAATRGPKRDLRRLNTTGRVVQFGTRIDAETDYRIREYCARQKDRRRSRDTYGACHFIEDAIDALEKLEQQDG